MEVPTSWECKRVNRNLPTQKIELLSNNCCLRYIPPYSIYTHIYIYMPECVQAASTNRRCVDTFGAVCDPMLPTSTFQWAFASGFLRAAPCVPHHTAKKGGSGASLLSRMPSKAYSTCNIDKDVLVLYISSRIRPTG